jgi:hypothetical protein
VVLESYSVWSTSTSVSAVSAAATRWNFATRPQAKRGRLISSGSASDVAAISGQRILHRPATRARPPQSKGFTSPGFPMTRVRFNCLFRLQNDEDEDDFFEDDELDDKEGEAPNDEEDDEADEDRENGTWYVT